jgi:glycogen debranching enzyme
MKAAFVRTFWLDAAHCLADVVTDGVPDAAVRPNQILAVSLPFSPLDGCQKIGVVDKVRKELLTPYGLRTLSPRDPAYRGRYEGDQNARDAAYHQGTVWPWLLGHFGEACLRTSMRRRETARTLLAGIEPLMAYAMEGAGLLNVPEIFDGDPPHRPDGCVAQAWSTAELIRLFTLCGRTFEE